MTSFLFQPSPQYNRQPTHSASPRSPPFPASLSKQPPSPHLFRPNLVLTLPVQSRNPACPISESWGLVSWLAGPVPPANRPHFPIHFAGYFVQTAYPFTLKSLQMDDNLQRRGQALEDMFFQQRDKHLMERLTREMADQQARDALAHVSGISNAKVLQALVDQKIGPGNIVCLTMVPLVCVAWADGELQDEERQTILSSASENGIKADSAAFELLDSWLGQKPNSELFDTWKLYVTSLKCTLDETAFRQVAQAILDRAEAVAKSAGGFLGMGSTSVSEKKTLEEIATVLHV